MFKTLYALRQESLRSSLEWDNSIRSVPPVPLWHSVPQYCFGMALQLEDFPTVLFLYSSFYRGFPWCHLFIVPLVAVFPTVPFLYSRKSIFTWLQSLKLFSWFSTSRHSQILHPSSVRFEEVFSVLFLFYALSLFSSCLPCVLPLLNFESKQKHF